MKSVHITTLASAVGVALVGAVTAPKLEASTLGAARFEKPSPVANRTAAIPGTLSESLGETQAPASGRYIVTFAEAGLVNYSGNVQGLARTAPHVDGVSQNSSRKFQIDSAASQSYKAYLETQRAAHVAAIEKKLGHALDIRFTYDVTRNGISAYLTPGEAAIVAKIAGVASVKPVGQKSTTTFRGPTFIGANKIWDGTSVPSYSSATKGFGVKVGVIDTGTNIGHPSFADDPACGFTAAAPKLNPRDCTVNNGSACTGTNPNAADGEGHGVHTSSTAAGNTIDNTYTPAPLLPNGVTMSGVAPCATLYTYRVADDDGLIYDDYLTAAFQNVITDQVDVANYSIGPTCGGGNPWADTDFLDMENADIFVAASAGNTRSSCTSPIGRVANNGPWEMTVAASSQDQQVGPTFSVTGPGTVDPVLTGIPVTPGSEPFTPPTLTGLPVKTYASNIAGCTDGGGIPAGTFTGAIAVLRRGATNTGGTACSFVEKVTNATNAGASAVIIGNNQAGTISMNTDGAPATPAYSISSQATSNALIDFALANSTATGNLAAVGIGNIQGDVLAGFSFRGPTQGVYDNLTKPDITGPGVNIYAALDDAEGSYGLMSGTSMSSPHIAGSGALIRAVHPDWTPMEVKSALQTTASIVGYQEDGTTQWTTDQVGSGRVDLSKAALAGLTMDETYANFVAANPNGGGLAQSQLNLASLRDVHCAGTCTWTRKFKNRLHASGSWTVTTTAPAGFTLTASPATFTLAQDAEQTVTFTATGSSTDIVFGSVTLHEGTDQSPDQHLTVAVKGALPTIQVTPTSLGATLDTDTTTTQNLNIKNVGGGSLTWSLPVSIAGSVWNQPVNGTSGIVSDYSSTQNGGAYTAADFVVASATDVTKITTNGFDNTGTLTATSSLPITWVIYTDAAGTPNGNPDAGTGTPVWTYSSTANGTGVTVTSPGTIALNLAAAGQSLNLPAGTYWLSVYPTYPNSITTAGAARWNWSQGADQGPTGAKLVSTLFGAPNWTLLTGLGLTWGDVAFSIDGSVSCGASWLSASPTSGTAAQGASNNVTVTFDATGMAQGSYAASLCVASNDTTTPTTIVPVTLDVNGPSDVIFADGFDGSTTPGGDACLNIDGFTTDGEWMSGSSLNTVVELNIGVGNEMTGAAADASITATSPSWLSESEVTFSASDDTTGDGAINLTMSATDASGTELTTTEGILYFSDYGLPNVPAGADGVLRLEWNEAYADAVHPNSVWNTSTDPVYCPGVHITCTDQAACDAAVDTANRAAHR